ncbi:MAG: glycosyltransferase family 1 protein [Candidatus Accumulibacter sp.]|uniref:Glycosyltransferase family 1 protein n=1 Tax=Candidatus Accumulibacter proximus TaxID=2954385 RepID=A0A935PZ05_9PROT|nr:glycosyltransferase family 1 protein [Candidatus Accumulibacter proximus]
MKVLHLPEVIGGNAQGLSRHLQMLGVDSVTWTVRQNYFGYPADRVIVNIGDSFLTSQFKKLLALRYVFGPYDIIHFNFGSSLFGSHINYRPNWPFWKTAARVIFNSYQDIMQILELKILHWRGVPCFVHYQGDDARQGDYCLKNFPICIASQVDKQYYNPDSDRYKARKIRRFYKYCSKTYALNPDLLHVLPDGTEFLPYSHISIDDWKPFFTQHESRPLRIGHAPSHRGVKGTDYLLRALDRLKADGYHFELALVENLSNIEARRCYETIDVLVDQLFAGWYGGVAVEAMALGKPVLVYIRQGDLRFIPEAMRAELPFIQVTPSTIEAGLRAVLDMSRQELLALAKKSRAYVEKWHDPLAIAQRVKQDYELALRKAGRL